MTYKVTRTNDKLETVVVAAYDNYDEALEKVLDLGDRSILAEHC